MALILDEKNFEQEIDNYQGLCVVDLWAPWCGPCKTLGPIIQELATELEGRVKIGKVNIDDNPKLAVRFGVTAIPSILFIRNGQIIGKQIGVLPKSKLEQKINSYL